MGHAGKVLGTQSSTIALLYFYVLCGANSAGVITLASQCHSWPKPDSFYWDPHRNIAPRLPCFCPQTLGLPYLGHCILLTTFCAQKILDLLLLRKLCGIFPGSLATSSGEERGVR